jgi:photosystem II stability/assembly factor-like uncharacterized protein
MTSSPVARQSAASNAVRLLALCVIWLMLVVAAVPIGSVNRTAASAAKISKASATEGADAEASTPDESTQARIAQAYGKLSLSFEANQGQFDRQVQFLARGGGYGLFLTNSEAVMVLSRPAAGKDRAERAKSPFAPQQMRNIKGGREDWKAEARERVKRTKTTSPQSAVVRMKLEGANPATQAEGLDQLPGRTNYFIGNDPGQWHTDVPSYARVMYRDVYPGVDLVYYGTEQQLEYDFVVAPGVDPNSITLNFEGAQGITVDAQGDLVLHTVIGDVRQHKPAVYQEVDGAKREIPSRYEMKGEQRVGFRVGAYDTTKPLVIDPILIYSTFLGGYYSEEGATIAVDRAGSAYVAGFTYSYDFPLVHPVQGYERHGLGFVSKLNRDGSALVYSTYLGGIGWISGIAVDRQGSAYLTGYTYSSELPVVNALQATGGGKSDPFVTKLSPQGSALIYSTYLGGENEDAGFGIAVDVSGNAYVTGATYSHAFPLVNPFQSKKAGHQAFKSTNSGDTWSASDSGLDIVRPDDLVIDPSNPNTMYSATELGVFKSTNGGQTWRSANRGLENVFFGDPGVLAIDPSHTSTIFFGTFDGLYISVNGGNSWARRPTAPYDPNAIAIGPQNPSIIYTYGYSFDENPTANFFKSTDGGRHWTSSLIVDRYGYQDYINSLVVDPNNSSIVYAGGSNDGIYKSTDGGAHWKRFNRGLFVSYILDLVIDPSNSSTIYAATMSGVYKSTNGGSYWQAVNNGLFESDYADVITSLAIDPLSPSVLYAGTYGGIFKTTDGGAQWTAADTGLTNRVVSKMAVDPTAPSKVYAMTISLADAFVLKLNPSGSARLYSTYLGGEESEWGFGIAVDRDGYAYLTGRTSSSNYPVENPLQPSHAGDAFITKMDPSGSSLTYSTYLGGDDSYDAGFAIAIDASGNAYVTGGTYSLNFPVTRGAFQKELNGDVDAFVTKINAAGSKLVYSTYLGGSITEGGFEYGYGIAVNSSGQAFVTGQTESTDFPLANATQSSLHGEFNPFVTRLNAGGSALMFSTYLGGSNLYFEQGNGIAVDPAGNAYVVGTTWATDFPVTPNAFQRSIGGDINDLYPDAFITKIGAPPASIQISGRVLLNRAGLGGVKVNLKNSAGGILQTTTTEIDGRYSFTAPGGRNYTVAPSKPGYTFDPPSLSYTRVGTNLPRQDFKAVPTN